jgi:hypothetical protein
MRRDHFSVLILLCVAAPAAADVTIDLKSKDPVSTLPAVSADGVNFLRPYRRWRPKCKNADVFTEMGGIDRSVDEPQYATAQLLGGCGEARDAFEGNVSMINESLHETKCSTAPDRGTMKAALPTSFGAGTFSVSVTAGPDSVLVLADPPAGAAGARAGERRMQVAGKPSEVHGWYLVDRGKNHALAVLVTVREADGTVSEQWIDVWLDAVPKKPAPMDVARAWLRASSRYAPGYDPMALEKITAKKIPAELAAQKKALSKPGLTLVAYETETDTLVLGIKKNKVEVVAETPQTDR